MKVALEKKLHKLVCARQLDLKTAQREIASDWIEAYKKSAGSTPSLVRFSPKKTCIRADSQLLWLIRTHQANKNNLLSLYPITSNNQCAKFGFLTQLDTNMAEERSQMPVYYRVDIGEEFPEQRGTPDLPHW